MGKYPVDVHDKIPGTLSALGVAYLGTGLQIVGVEPRWVSPWKYIVARGLCCCPVFPDASINSVFGEERGEGRRNVVAQMCSYVGNSFLGSASTPSRVCSLGIGEARCPVCVFLFDVISYVHSVVLFEGEED